MSFKEITELRKNGNILAAYEMATAYLQAEPDSIWAKRAMAWCIYAFIKENAICEHREAFIERLLELKNLNLPEDETMIFDSIAWPIYSIIKSCKQAMFVSNDFFYQLFNILKLLHFSRPSKEYSILFKAFLTIKDAWSGFIDFCDWWNFDNFLPEDYQKEKYNNKEIISLVERAYIAYAKVLLENREETNKNLIENFLPKLSTIIEKHSEYQYPLYYKAKLLLSVNNKTEAIETLRPFILKKQNDFWVWELLGDASDDENMRYSCYCKALLCRPKDEMSVSLRQKMADLLANKKMYNEAKTEIEKILSIRKSNNWKISQSIVTFTNQQWYVNAECLEANYTLYQKNAELAESFLYSNLPQIPVLISFVNKNKSIASFITVDKQQGFFKYSKKIIPQINNIYLIRIQSIKTNDITHVLSIEKTNDNNIASKFFTEDEGVIKINANGFGFINNIFVNSDLVQNIDNMQRVRVVAVPSYDKKKNVWGLKAISIKKI